MTTGVSFDRIDVIRREPMPGTRKICSVTSAPVKIWGTWIASKVTTGMSALRTTCFTRVRLSASPFDRAVRM